MRLAQTSILWKNSTSLKILCSRPCMFYSHMCSCTADIQVSMHKHCRECCRASSDMQWEFAVQARDWLFTWGLHCGRESKLPGLHCIQGVRRNVHMAGALEKRLALWHYKLSLSVRWTRRQPTPLNGKLMVLSESCAGKLSASWKWLGHVTAIKSSQRSQRQTRHHSTGRFQCKTHMSGLHSALACICIHATMASRCL